MKILLLAACLIITGCAKTASPTEADAPTVQIVTRSAHCESRQAGARLLVGISEASEALGKSVETNIDPNRAALILVSLGTRPTPGYQVTLQSSRHKPDADTYRLPIAYEEPAEDAIMAQVITTPCALLAVDRTPGIHTLTVPLYGGGETNVYIN
ncbi:MAG: protease complex subunit PrcB family protein [Pseudomonadales bacterium]